MFAAAAQAPLTAIASVAEMTGNFTLTLPIMLACGIAAQLAKQITYGSIYTTKLLRRGIDIERPKALGALQAVTVREVMQPVDSLNGEPLLLEAGSAEPRPAVPATEWERLVGPVTLARRPQVLFAEEDLEQARRQLVLYGRDGLPVLSREGHLRGWLTRADVLRALATKLRSSEEQIEEGAVAAEFAVEDPSAAAHAPSTPLRGYEMLEAADPAGITGTWASSWRRRLAARLHRCGRNQGPRDPSRTPRSRTPVRRTRHRARPHRRDRTSAPIRMPPAWPLAHAAARPHVTCRAAEAPNTGASRSEQGQRRRDSSGSSSIFPGVYDASNRDAGDGVGGTAVSSLG